MTALPKLTGSQVRSAAAGLGAFLVTVNEVLQQIAGTPSIHLPVWATAVIQVIGLYVTANSRSLNKSNSGTGSGLVGSAPDVPSDIAHGTAMTTPATTAAETQEIVSATGAASSSTEAQGISLLLTLANSLPEESVHVVLADAAQLLSNLHTKAAQEKTESLDRTQLLAGIAAKADAASAESAPPAAVVPAPAAPPSVIPAVVVLPAASPELPGGGLPQ